MNNIEDQSAEKYNLGQRKITQAETISSRVRAIVFYGCSLTLCFVIIINAVYQTPLFILGINFIYQYQKHQDYNSIHFIQNVFSLLCNPIGVGVVLVLYYIIVNRKLLLIVHLSYFLLAAYIMALLKQSFQQSRPIWVDDRIQKWEWFCPKDFGNPSGHSFAVSLLYEPIISDSIGYGRYRKWAIVLLILCVMVPLSRMYLGVHSLNQILFGLALGQIFLILYKYKFQKYLYFLYWTLLMEHKKYTKLAIAIIFNIISFIIPIIFYHINRKQRPIPETDINNLNLKCGIQTTGIQTQGHMLVSCAGFSFFFGIIYGFVLLMDTTGYRKYLLGLWTYESYKHIGIKILVYLICAVFPAGVFFLISKYAVSHQNSIGKYIVSSFISLFFGLGLSYFAPMLTLKLKIMRFERGSNAEQQKIIEMG